MAYATDRKVVGLIKLPMDGDLYKSIGAISHAHDVSFVTIMGMW